MNEFTRFLNYWSGVDNTLLDCCPSHERSKYANIGALVLLTGTFAFMASAYALFTVFESVRIGVVLGLLWALFILNVDRLLLTTFPKCEGRLRQVLLAFPRLVLAFFIGITVAHPLTLRFFEPEIVGQIGEEYDAAVRAREKERNDGLERVRMEAEQRKRELLESKVVDRKGEERGQAKEEIAKCESQVRQYEQDYQKELAGTGETHVRGEGPSSRARLATYQEHKNDCRSLPARVDAADRELTQATQVMKVAAQNIDKSLEEQEGGLKREHEEGLGRLKSSQSRSFLKRSEMLGSLSESRTHVFRIWLFVSLLFIVVEVAPVAMKFMAPTDSADRLAFETSKTFAANRIANLSVELSLARTEATSPRSATGSGFLSTGSPLRQSAVVMFGAFGLTFGLLSLGARLDWALWAGGIFASVAPLAVRKRT